MHHDSYNNLILRSTRSKVYIVKIYPEYAVPEYSGVYVSLVPKGVVELWNSTANIDVHTKNVAVPKPLAG
jgi:hypothetical protein